MKRILVAHVLFWLFSCLLLSGIYGVAYGHYGLGLQVILMLLPVHMAYLYAVAYWAVPKFFLRRRYGRALIAVVTAGFGAAVLYRLNEIFISDPFIFNYFNAKDPAFTWTKLDGSWWEQLTRPLDFVNAVERSNVVIWIGVTLRFIQLWYERQQAALQAELNFLKAQIHPHFLFNTLNNLYALSLESSQQTPPVILGLSNILRYMLYECKAEQVTLQRDLEILQNYVALEKIRYESRLDLNFHVQGRPGAHRIAPLLMLPLIENAFKHGVSETIDAPWINIELEISDQHLQLKVSNSQPENKAVSKAGESVGLSNVQKRLELLYPGRHHLEIFNDEEIYLVLLDIQLCA